MINEKPLIIFEMANNHMGDVDHGLLMIETFAKVAEKHPSFQFAFKFQFRDIPSFIHPDYQEKTDIKYVKRFKETTLSDEAFTALIDKTKELNLLAITTPFDEPSVDLAVKLDVDRIKIASCSFADWPLLEKIALTDKPLIVSTAGAALEEIDKVVGFLEHREKEFALMHCVGEYPTVEENLQINQISLLLHRYPGVAVGFSTHEDPKNYDSVFVALGKGAQILEKHVAIETEKYPKNAYSATPEDVEAWLVNAERALKMLGVKGDRQPISEKELADLRQFKRGAFLKKDLKKGDVLKKDDAFFAFPCQAGQVLANDWSKYKSFTLKEDLAAASPVLENIVECLDHREEVYKIVQDVKAFVKQSGVVHPGGAELEISHHYGLAKFYETGITMITVVNRDYCKKLIVVLPGQTHPEQYHKEKEETFHILYGDVQLYLNGEPKGLVPGDAVTIEREVRHRFTTEKGCVIEEISSTHFKDDSYYTDESIMKNKERKTLLKHWLV